ncbi:MAG: hypothetical protein J6386_20790 [Candidatus Synoicihabitans palmerolidicus]|nr:hypothetical protein [Candidatus Synoicihabitans palmerolidicus]
MSHYEFATSAERTLGIAFLTESTGKKAVVFQRQLIANGNSPQQEIDTDRSFEFAMEVLDGKAMLGMEVNGWAARPYMPTTIFCLGDPDVYPSGRDEVRYSSSRTTPVVASKMYFRYEPTGGGHDKDRPYLTWWFEDPIPGKGTMVFTPESPGVIVALRLNGSAKGKFTGLLPTAIEN